MSETRFFDAGTTPEFCTEAWYSGIERAPHWEQDAHRPRLVKAVEFVIVALMRGASSVCDLGAGDGGLLAQLPADVEAWGFDLIPANVHAAQSLRHVDVELENMDNLDPHDYGDCVVLTETLEHLTDPHRVLGELPPVVRFVVASSPNNETWESRYEFHSYGWDMDGYRAMFEGAGWRVLRHEAIPGFQVLLAGRP